LSSHGRGRHDGARRGPEISAVDVGTDSICWHHREMNARAVLSGSEIGLRPLTARSIVLSLLLAAHPAELPARDLVRAAAFFDVPENTLRSALSRMVSAGDLLNTGSVYELSDRLLARQQRRGRPGSASPRPRGARARGVTRGCLASTRQPRSRLAVHARQRRATIHRKANRPRTRACAFALGPENLV
jgi:hypothetical protein